MAKAGIWTSPKGDSAGERLQIAFLIFLALASAAGALLVSVYLSNIVGHAGKEYAAGISGHVNVLYLGIALVWSAVATWIVMHQMKLRMTSLNLIKLANVLLLTSVAVYAGIFITIRVLTGFFPLIGIALLLSQVAAAGWFGIRYVTSNNPAHNFKNMLGKAVVGLCGLVVLICALMIVTPGISLRF